MKINIELLIIFFSIIGLFIVSIRPRYEYALEIEYKDKIIQRECGKNFESYEDYLVWRIEKGE